MAEAKVLSIRRRQLFEIGVPAHMHDGIELYLDKGVLPGGFLTKIFENDFVEAAGQGDDENQRALLAYAKMLYCMIPHSAWGSKEKVLAWCDAKRGAGS